MSTYQLRYGTVQGVKHARLNMNNQDAALVLEFGIPKWGTNYRIGLVSDGCSGIPRFTHTEVGSNLLVLFCMARIQELIKAGARMEDIPLPLYHAVTNFVRDLSNMVAPASFYWPYPVTFRGEHEFRNRQKAPERFTVDYLAATLLGFVDDGTTLVTFQAGDGVRIVNDTIDIIDQNDRPEYPALSVNSPGGGFATNVYASAEVQRIALATDGLEELLQLSAAELPEALFTHAADDPMGLQYLLNILRRRHGEAVSDDCTVVAMAQTEGGST